MERFIIGIENSSEPAERSKHSFMENPKEVYFIIGGCTTMQLLNKKRTITFCANSHICSPSYILMHDYQQFYLSSAKFGSGCKKSVLMWTVNH